MASGEGEGLAKLLASPELDAALEDFLRIVVKMKESGLLDMMAVLAERYEEMLQSVGGDMRVYHALAAAQAALDGMKEADPWKYKPAIQLMTSCVFRSMDPERLSEAKPVGLLGLLSALRDPDVGFGLGVLLAMAKLLGRCMREEMERMKKMAGELAERDLSAKRKG